MFETDIRKLKCPCLYCKLDGTEKCRACNIYENERIKKAFVSVNIKDVMDYLIKTADYDEFSPIIKALNNCL